MAEKQYTYEVARIRAKELSLLNASTVEQLVSAKNLEQCLQLLSAKGWNDAKDPDELLRVEESRIWDLLQELVEDRSVFDVLLYSNDYHNLKAAIKLVYTDTDLPNVFLSTGTIDPDLIQRAVREQDWTLLPESMQHPAQEAFEALLHTRDGQLCDIILDRAALEAIYQGGKNAENALIKEYAELTVAAADIKIAVRAQKTGKSLDFLRRALASCDSLDAGSLAAAAAQRTPEAIYNYLQNTSYADAVQALKDSPSAFECWLDNLIIRRIRPQQSNPFTIGPLAAYALARQNEIKTVRIILSGKINGLSQDSIRKRIREMYGN